MEIQGGDTEGGGIATDLALASFLWFWELENLHKHAINSSMAALLGCYVQAITQSPTEFGYQNIS